MTVRLALPTDAAPITTMYNAAVPTINTYWATGAAALPQSWFDSRIAAGQVYVSAATALAAARGFIMRRPSLVDGDAGDEMDLWIIPTTSSDAQMKAWTKELWIRWAQDFITAPWLWGRNAGAYPLKSEKVITAMKSKGLIIGANIGGFRIAKMRPADLLTMLGQI